MKILLSLLFLLFITSCDFDIKKGSIRTINIENKKNLYIYEIDGHEYIGRITSSNNGFLIHSESCKHESHKIDKGSVIVLDNGDMFKLCDTIRLNGQINKIGEKLLKIK